MKTITFYSYKGGVGRSLALANIATRLTEFRRKVCLIDFDLEAPGLQFKFPHGNEVEIKQGIVDYIYQFSTSGTLPGNLKDYSVALPRSSQSELTLLPAGNVNSKDYWQRLSSINWADLLYKNKNGIRFFFDLKEKIKTQFNPDYLLVDSRTGITEMSGITLSLLADEIVIVAANNKENLFGSQKIIESLSKTESNLKGVPPKITFVLSRIPFTDNPIDRAKEQNLIAQIQRTYLKALSTEINVIHSDRELEENEKLKIGYEKDATTAQISRDYLNLFEQLTQNDFSEVEIARFNNIKKAESYFLAAFNSKSPRERIDLVTQALELSSNNISFTLFRANEFFLQKDYENSLSDLSTITSKVAFIPALELQAKVYTAMGNDDDSRRIYSKILTLSSKNSTALIGLGNIAYREKDFTTSVDFFTRAIELLPENPDPFVERAKAYMQLRNFEMSLSDIFYALALDPNHVIGLATLAQIKGRQGQTNEFYLYLEMALKLDSKVVESYIATEKYFSEHCFSEPRFQKLMEKYNTTLVLQL